MMEYLQRKWEKELLQMGYDNELVKVANQYDMAKRAGNTLFLPAGAKVFAEVYNDISEALNTVINNVLKAKRKTDFYLKLIQPRVKYYLKKQANDFTKDEFTNPVDLLSFFITRECCLLMVDSKTSRRINIIRTIHSSRY